MRTRGSRRRTYKAPAPLRAIELVRRADEQVRQPGVDRYFAYGLGGVRHKKHAPGAGYFRYAFYGLDRARLVVRPHHGNENRVVAEGALQCIEIEQPVRIHGQVGDLVSFSFQRTVRVEHRPVFGLYCHEVASPGPVHLRHSLDGRIGPLRSPGGEHDFSRFRRNGGSHLLPGLFASFLPRPAEGMSLAGGVAVLPAKPGQHGLQDTFVHRSGRVVIEVDDSLHDRGGRIAGRRRSDYRTGD